MCSTGGVHSILIIVLCCNYASIGAAAQVYGTPAATAPFIKPADDALHFAAVSSSIAPITATTGLGYPRHNDAAKRHRFFSSSYHDENATADRPTNAYESESPSPTISHFIDITRKPKIHYNGLVIDEDNIAEHLHDHERELIFGKSRKSKRPIKLVHLTYRPTATQKAASAYGTTDASSQAKKRKKEGEAEAETRATMEAAKAMQTLEEMFAYEDYQIENQIPNNSIETATNTLLHRHKRSDNERGNVKEASTSKSPRRAADKMEQSEGDGQPGIPPGPTVSIQIKDNDRLVNLKLQQTTKLIDDAFIFIRRTANTSQLVEDSYKLAERLEKCFYHSENSALDLCDKDNVRGVFHHNRTDYIIHPLPDRFGNQTHIILESESELFDSRWSNSSVLNEHIQFEPELEDFNDLAPELRAPQENSTTTRSTRNVDDHPRSQTRQHHKHSFNLRYKPPRHHNQEDHHHHHQHHQQTEGRSHRNHHRTPHHHQTHHAKHHSKYWEHQKSPKRARRYISQPKPWLSNDVLLIETAIFVDTDLYTHMMKNFPKDTSSHLIRFVLAMINGVQLLYHHPSLGRRVNFVLKRLEILEKDPLELRRSSDIDIYLSNFCKWQTKWNPSKDSDPMHYDHAVILTGLDLYVVNKNGKLISQVVGLAPVAGMCIPSSSCTVNEGKHFDSVFVVAHEIGHNLGMRHDSTDNACDPTSHIMSPTLGTGKTTWSKCSRDSLNMFLEKKQADCLFNRAEFGHNLDHSAEGILPGERFDANQQCMLKYGKDSKRAVSQKLPDICRDLHCQRNRYTLTSHPALDGTTCGDNMWCRSGVCVIKRFDNYLSPKQVTSAPTKASYDKAGFLDNSKAGYLLHEYQKPSSSWSDWSEPSICESSCLYGPSKRLREGSTGLKTFTRKCIDYKRRCMGRDRKFETCVAKQCYVVPIITIEDFARQVCERAQKFDGELTGEGEQKNGNIEESCKVYCRTKNNGTKSRSWTFPDGTTCRSTLFSGDEPSYCIQGRCEKFSCDNSTGNYHKIDNIFCKQQEKYDNNQMDNETIRRSSTQHHQAQAQSSSQSQSQSLPQSQQPQQQQSYSNHIPVGWAADSSYDSYKYRSANQNYYEPTTTAADRIYGPTTVRSKYENEVAARPFHGQYNHDAYTYKSKSDNFPPWNKYSYHLNDYNSAADTSQPAKAQSVAPASSSENDWIVKSGCHTSCMARSKGIQVVVNRKTRVKNIQLCSHSVKPCDRLQSAAEFADNTCARYKLKVRGLSGHGIQIAASVDDPDRSCRVGCQDEFIGHRFYLVNGNYGHFPLGTRCSHTEERYCVQGKCLQFGSDQIPLQQSHISLALFRSRRSTNDKDGRGQQEELRRRSKRSFLYYDPVNITETLTQDFINSIVNSIITLEEKQTKDDALLQDHIEFTNPINYSMDETSESQK